MRREEAEDQTKYRSEGLCAAKTLACPFNILSYASLNDYEYPTAWLKLTKMDQPFLARLRSMEEIAFKLQILMPEEVLISVGAFTVKRYLS
jgi:hypothetical protein